MRIRLKATEEASRRTKNILRNNIGENFELREKRDGRWFLFAKSSDWYGWIPEKEIKIILD